MNKKQKKQLEKIDSFEGIGQDVKNTLKKWDKSGLIKPEWKIIPLLYLIVDDEKLTETSYKEYEEEYGY